MQGACAQVAIDGSRIGVPASLVDDPRPRGRRAPHYRLTTTPTFAATPLAGGSPGRSVTR